MYGTMYINVCYTRTITENKQQVESSEELCPSKHRKTMESTKDMLQLISVLSFY